MPAADGPAGERNLPRCAVARAALRRSRQIKGFEEHLRAAGVPDPGQWGPPTWSRWAATAATKHDFFHPQLVDSVAHGTPSGAQILQATVEAAALANASYEMAREAAIKERREATRSRLEAQGTGATACFRLLRKPPTPPLTFLRDRDGLIKSDPSEVDAVARREWESVYKGTALTDEVVVQQFDDAFGNLAFRGPCAPLPPIDRRAFHRHVTSGPHKAGGLDNWTPAEWTLLSKEATSHMALLLESIESGASWPQQALVCRAAFTAKAEEPDPDDPLAFRLLSVLSVLSQVGRLPRQGSR